MPWQAGSAFEAAIPDHIFDTGAGRGILPRSARTSPEKRTLSPFVYVTGYGKLLRACNHGRPVLQKPYNNQQMLNIIGQWPPRLRPAATDMGSK